MDGGWGMYTEDDDLPNFCHMLKSSHAIMTLISPYLQKEEWVVKCRELNTLLT